MGFSLTYAEIREMVRKGALQTKTARAIMRKAGFRVGSPGGSNESPILSLMGSRRVCFDPDVIFADYPGIFALKSGRLYAWGENSFNIFGLTEETLVDYYATPTALHEGIAGLGVEQVVNNQNQSLLRLSDGTVMRNAAYFTPSATGYNFVPEESGLTDVIWLESHHDAPSGPWYALKGDGTIWGKGQWMVGMGGNTAPYAPAFAWSTNVDEFQQLPSSKVNPGGAQVMQIAAGLRQLSWLLDDGRVLVWQNLASDPFEPADVPSGIAKLRSSDFPIFALTDTGEIWSAGTNTNGEAGIGTFDPLGSGIAFSDWRQAIGDGYTDMDAASVRAVMAVKDGYLWTWGAGDARSARGLGAPPVATPTQITTPDVSDVVAVYGDNGAPSLFYKTQSGCCYAWGENVRGSLGQGYRGSPNIGVPTPLLISAPIPIEI